MILVEKGPMGLGAKVKFAGSTKELENEIKWIMNNYVNSIEGASKERLLELVEEATKEDTDVRSIDLSDPESVKKASEELIDDIFDITEEDE